MLILGFPPIEFIRRFLALFEMGIARAIFFDFGTYFYYSTCLL
jgi:hypothetical protein